MTTLHPHVERAALSVYRSRQADVLATVRAAAEAERGMILDVVEVLAGQADCPHQREPLNRILYIFGRGTVDDATLQTPDHCAMETT